MSFLKLILNDFPFKDNRKQSPNNQTSGGGGGGGISNSVVEEVRNFGNKGYWVKVNGNLISVDQKYLKNLQNMQALQKSFGAGRIHQMSDGTFTYTINGKTYFGNNKMRDSDGNMNNYSLNDIINPKSTNSKEPKGPKDKTHTLPEVTIRPETHTATYNDNRNSWSQDQKTALLGRDWTTNDWGYNGNKKGVITDDVRTELGLDSNAIALDAQRKLISLGYGIKDDNVWGKQSLAAFERYKQDKQATTTYKTEADKLKSVPLIKPVDFSVAKNPLYANSQYTPTQKLLSFDANDLRQMNFHNYGEMVNAFNSGKYKDNNFYKYMTTRYGSNTANWNQDTIESDADVKGHYGSFGRGDFGDWLRSQDSYITNYNTQADTKNKLYSTFNKHQEFARKHDMGTVRDYGVPKTFGSLLTPKVNVKEENKLPSTDEINQKISSYNTQQKYQQGGTINMDEQQQLQQAFLQYLAQETGAKSEQELEQVIQQLGEDGLKQAYAQFMQAMQQQTVQAARFGAKLNYINRLNGKCPAGTQMQYYKVGGRLCKKCMQMEAQGGSVKKQSGDAIDEFKLKQVVIRNRKKYGKKYDEDQLAGRKPVGKNK